MKLLVTGSLGQLGQEFIRIQKASKHEFIFTDIVDLDISSKRSINSFLNKKQIDCIINCAAYTNVSKAEIEKEKALKINSKAVKNLVKYSEKKNIKLIHFSTDYVYNSKNLKPIKEENCINPQNYYGFSKRQGEKHIENSESESIVIRTSWLYSKFGNNFVNTIIKKSSESKDLKVVDDQFGCPTYAKDLAEAVLKILDSDSKIDKKSKIFNFSNMGSTNWFNFAKKILHLYGSDTFIKPVKSDYFNYEVKRPKFTITDKSRITKSFNIKINDWEKSLANYIKNDL